MNELTVIYFVIESMIALLAFLSSSWPETTLSGSLQLARMDGSNLGGPLCALNVHLLTFEIGNEVRPFSSLFLGLLYGLLKEPLSKSWLPLP